jgi:O-antigen/teichoic acid export membrane protein
MLNEFRLKFSQLLSVEFLANVRSSEFKIRFIKLFSVDFLAKAGAFILLPLYLNFMTQEEFGRYSYLLSVVGVLSFVFGLGQHVNLSRFFHTSEYSRQTLIETIHLILATSILFFSVILLGFKDIIKTFLFKSAINDTIYVVAVVLAIIMALNQILMMFLYQSEKIALVQGKNIFTFLCINSISLTSLYFIALPGDEVRMTALLVSYVLILLIFYGNFFSFRSLRFKYYSKELYVRGIKNGFPIAVGSFANFFIAFGDRFVIDKLLDATALGVFSFAMTIVGVLLLIFNSFQNVWLPYLFKEKNISISLKRVYKIISLFGVVSLLTGAGFYLIVFVLTRYFIDPSYIQSLDFLWLLVLATFFQIAGMFIAGFYQIFEKNHISIPINIIAGVLNIGMNYFFINHFGLIGAALATVLISLILFIFHFTLVHYYKRRGVFGEYFADN